jgi:hypothetical protein
MMTKKQMDFDRSNTFAARIILMDPDKFGGEEALSVRWARMFIARLEGERTRERGRVAA